VTTLLIASVLQLAGDEGGTCPYQRE